jgi:hypothetical protein
MTGETLTSPIDLKEQLADIAAAGLADEQDEVVSVHLPGRCSTPPALRSAPSAW